MKIRVPKSQQEFGRDMKTFEQLPATTKESLILQQRAEKGAVPVVVAPNDLVRKRARLKSSLPTE